MFICVCNAITERQVQTAVADGAVTLSQLQGELGIASCCGRCADTATEYLPGGRYASTAVHPRSDVGTMVSEAANDPIEEPGEIMVAVAVHRG